MDFNRHFQQYLEGLRLRLSQPNALLPLAFLGVLTGLITGTVIVLFRLLVDCLQFELLAGQGDNYQILSSSEQFIYPIVGSLIIILLFRFFSHGPPLLGIASVIKQMACHQGYFNLRGLLLQFFGAVVALVSGHSVGREGPNVYLGAASSSLLGQLLVLPNNSIRTLVGCGTAGGIAASFDTPLAGVIFALEVIMMEYTLTSFMPIILAAGSATSISILVFGHQPAFVMPNINLGTLIELPFVIILGLLAGTFSAFFIELLKLMAQYSKQFDVSYRLLTAGILLGSIALVEPRVMGIGYDTVSQTLAGELVWNVLLILLVCKLLATTVSIGLGIPGGVIGPAIFLGACLGSLFAVIIDMIFPDLSVDIGFYSVYRHSLHQLLILN
jgi:H+/Cl- antiporter ClcA